MGSVTGGSLKVSIFGESHGKAIGAVIDGLPSGIAIDMELIREQMTRRAPGGDKVWSTKRKEADVPEIISGVWNGMTTGTPLCALIANTDTKSSDYSEFTRTPRPGHADLTAILRYSGYSDPRGGGHFSGRLTAAMVFAGAVCNQVIKKRHPVSIYSRICSIGDITDFSDAENISDTEQKRLVLSDFPVIDRKAGEDMIDLIRDAAGEADSVGGVIETIIKGFPFGIGDPIFEGMESRIAALVFSVPAVKGVEFGSGFAGTKLRGSVNNDGFCYCGQGNGNEIKDIRTCSNNAGGILGGITTGMPIVLRTAVKPTASVGRQQNSIDLETAESKVLKIKGRHDPCIVPRAVPVIEAVCCIALLDSLLHSEGL